MQMVVTCRAPSYGFSKFSGTVMIDGRERNIKKISYSCAGHVTTLCIICLISFIEEAFGWRIF